jgi:hypothetical protein
MADLRKRVTRNTTKDFRRADSQGLSEYDRAESSPSGTASMDMQRGVTQLLFHYLPGRMVDWENGLAIVMLTRPRLAPPAWSDERAAIVLDEINLLLDRWRKKGGSVDRRFPDPASQRGSFAIGSPEAIEAEVLETALICQTCSRLHFTKLSKIAHVNSKALACPDCGTPTLRQLGQVFVHGCGEYVPITEWMPATKKTEEGSITHTVRPLRCQVCGPEGRLAFSIRTERVKDMKLECRKCGTVVLERLTARCKSCLEELAAAESVHTQNASDDIETTGSIVSRIAMRMARYNASATYYPQTLSMLRLDRPTLTRAGDEEVEILRRMLPVAKRPNEEPGAASAVAQLATRLQRAELADDREEMKRIRDLILKALEKDK